MRFQKRCYSMENFRFDVAIATRFTSPRCFVDFRGIVKRRKFGECVYLQPKLEILICLLLLLLLLLGSLFLLLSYSLIRNFSNSLIVASFCLLLKPSISTLEIFRHFVK
ncbi:hypothetical protein ACOME3_004107 [Neoechinorhynchus agilis]